MGSIPVCIGLCVIGRFTSPSCGLNVLEKWKLTMFPQFEGCEFNSHIGQDIFSDHLRFIWVSLCSMTIEIYTYMYMYIRVYVYFIFSSSSNQKMSTIRHCLGLGHETIVRVVQFTILFRFNCSWYCSPFPRLIKLIHYRKASLMPI